MGTPIAMIILPLFGIITMSLLMGVHLQEVPRRNIIMGLAFLAVMIALNIFVDDVLGRDAYRALYFFLIQLPMFILFRIITPYRGVKLIFATLTTMTIATLPVNINLAVSTLIIKRSPVTNAVLFVSCMQLLVLIYFFMKPDFNYILQHGESRELWKFCVIPVIYYVYSFGLTGYNFTKDFAASGFLLHRIPDVIVLVSYMLLVNIFRNTRENQLMKGEQAMLTVRLLAADEKMAELHTTTLRAAAHRHDLRHHLSLLNSFAMEGDIGKIKAYLVEAQGELDAITPMHYCENETANLLFSAFDNKAKASGVVLSVEAQLPKELPIPNTELCAVLSNGIENAIDAVAHIKNPSLGIVRIDCFIKREKLLLMIENPYTEAIKMENGIPVSTRKGHGFGCRSIAAIAEKRKGYCTFTAMGGTFIMRVILPLWQ